MKIFLSKINVTNIRFPLVQKNVRMCKDYERPVENLFCKILKIITFPNFHGVNTNNCINYIYTICLAKISYCCRKIPS